MPNLYNFDIIQDDDNKLVIKRNATYTLWSLFKIIFNTIIYFIAVMYATSSTFNMCKEMMQNGKWDHSCIMMTISILSPIYLIYIIYCYAIHNYFKKSGFYISIDEFLISISKLRFTKSKPNNAKNIYIEEKAFEGCTSLKVKIPKSAIEIGNNSFQGVEHIEYHGKATGTPWGAKSIN